MYGQNTYISIFTPYFGSLVLKPVVIIEISSFSLASYVASCVMYIQIQKPILFHHWFSSLAVKAGEIIEISIMSHLFSPFS